MSEYAQASNSSSIILECVFTADEVLTNKEYILPSSMLNCVDSWTHLEELEKREDETVIQEEHVSSDSVQGELLKGHWSLDWLYVTFHTILAFPSCELEPCRLWESVKKLNDDTSDAYAVQLYIMGQWREVRVDDEVPVDANGQPLFIHMSPFQIWPLVITKAILRVMHAYHLPNMDCLHQVPFYNWLTGWPTEDLFTLLHRQERPTIGKEEELFRCLEDVLNSNKTHLDGVGSPAAICYSNLNADHHYCTSEEVEETRRRGNVDSLKGENASECASDLAKLLIVCGTTGCKKRRLISRLLNEFPQYFESVPLHTTKSSNETCTRLDAWLFQDEDTMRNDVEAGKYLFHDEIYDWLYGYKLEDIEARKLSGKVPTVILDNVRLLPQLVQQEIDCFLLFLQPTLSGDMLSKKSETSKGNGGSADAEAQMNCLKSSEISFTVVKLAEEMEVSYHRLLQELYVLYPQILPSHAIWGYGRQLWNASYRVEGRRPLHVIVLGSSKKHTTILSKELSQVFQVPMFIFPELMEENLSGSLSDDYIVDILTQKLECEECMVKGWILVGFPFTNTQQIAMEAKGLIPDKVILLETNLLQLNKEDSSNKGEVQVEEERETFDCVGQVCKANTEELRRAFFPVSYDVPKDSTLEDALEQASSFIRVESSLGCNLLSQEPTTPQGYISSVIKYQRKLLVAVSEHKGKEKWLEASNLFDKAQHLILLHNPKMYSYVKSYTRRDIQTMEEDIVLKVIADAPGQLLMCLDVGLEEESEAFQHSKSHPFVLCMKKFDINSTTKLSHIDHDIEIRTQTVSCQSIRFLAGDSLYSIKADRCRPYTLNVYSNAEIELQSLDKTLEDFEYFVTCYTGEIQAPNTDNVIAILFRIEISVQMETVIEAKVTLNDETLERNLYFSLDNDIKVLNRCPYVKCKPEEGIHTLIAAFQQPSERKLFPKSMNWKLQLIADQKSVQFQQLPIQEVQKMTGVYEQNLNRRFCRHVITAKTKTEMSVVLALSNANLEFVFRVVSVPKSGVQWNGKIEETDVVYSNKFVGLGLILSIRLLPGKYLIEAVFQNSGSIQDETSWTLLISPSCSPGSLSIQPDQSRNELIKDSVKKWMEEKGGVKTRSIRATEALQNYENSKTL